MLDQPFSQKKQTSVIHSNVRIVVIIEIALGQILEGVGCDSSAKTHGRLVKYVLDSEGLEQIALHFG